MNTKAVAYLRVSTAGQGRSGLGLEAQQSAVHVLAERRGLRLLATFTEVESGKNNDRPELQQALQLAKLTGAVLVIAKLDRLSRNAAFLLTLRDSGVRFLAADMPDANDLTIGLLAIIAQAEREAISNRTKEALNSVRQRIANAGSHTSSRSGRVIGRLGNPDGNQPLLKAGKGNVAAVEACKRLAQLHAAAVAPIISDMRRSGITSLEGMAKELNRRGVLTARQAKWHASTVLTLVKRLGDRPLDQP